MTTEIIDRFVEYLIEENCEGCTECDPRLNSNFYPGLACCEEGRAKWIMDRAEEFKKRMKGEKVCG